MGNQLILRPPIDELIYQAFDRPFHPEIIHSLSSRTFERDGYLLKLHLTQGGHVVEWSYKGTYLVEVLGDSSQVVPENGQIFAHRVGGERSESFSPTAQIKYQTCFFLERVPTEVYLQVDGELRNDSKQNGVIQILSPTDRLGISPLSYVDLQARKNSLVIHTYHTFPSDYAVVKSQTLIEIAE